MHLHRLISAFVNRLLESITSRLATTEISILQLVSEAEQACFNLTLSEALKIGFLALRPKYAKHFILFSIGCQI